MIAFLAYREQIPHDDSGGEQETDAREFCSNLGLLTRHRATARSMGWCGHAAVSKWRSRVGCLIQTLKGAPR